MGVVPASDEEMLASTSGQPLWLQVQVNSLTDDAHSSGLLAHMPPLALKHQPHPCTGVHVSHVVFAEQASPPLP